MTESGNYNKNLKESIEEFGRIIDFHNQRLVDEKLRKYSIMFDSENDEFSNERFGEISKCKKM